MAKTKRILRAQHLLVKMIVDPKRQKGFPTIRQPYDWTYIYILRNN